MLNKCLAREETCKTGKQEVPLRKLMLEQNVAREKNRTQGSREESGFHIQGTTCL